MHLKITFFYNLIFNNKFTVIVNTLLCLMVLCSIAFLNDIYSFKIKYIFFTSAATIFLSIFGNRFIFAIFSLFVILLALAESHFIRVYGFHFQLISEQILTVILDSSNHEIFSYLKIISFKEYTLLCISVLMCLLSVFTKKFEILYNKLIKTNTTFVNAIGNIILSLLLVFWGTCDGIPKIYKKLIQESSIYTTSNPLRANNLIQKKLYKWNCKASNNSPQNVILIIGESHRRDYFLEAWNKLEPLNYEYSFSNMISQYSYTLRAIPQILSRKPLNYAVDEFYESSLFKLFEEAGYTTHYIGYQPVNWEGDGAINYYVSETQNYYQFLDNKKRDSKIPVDDIEVLPIIKKIINNKNKNFIVVKLIGVHYNFEDRYYKEDDIVKPSLYDNQVETKKENKHIFVNTYINAMNYSTSVIHKLFEYVDTIHSPTIISFISDHGINIFDDGNWNIGSSKKAFEIPFIIKCNYEYISTRNLTKWNNLKLHVDEPLISNDLFETIVSLSEIVRPNIYNYDLTTEIIKNRKKREISFSSNKSVFIEDLTY